MVEQRLQRISPSGVLAMQAGPGLLLLDIAGQVTWAEYEPMLDEMGRAAQLGTRYLVLNRVAATSVREAPDDEFRKHAAKVTHARYGDRIAAFAHLVIGDGFMASATRAVIIGVTAVSRAPYPEKSFADPEAAAQWLAPQLPDGPSPQTILTQLDELVRAHTG